ncbi:hypothetical protein Naga_100573g1 [Nannochloropsis gaditana]|uniref:Uncharacterized protein n=1 Tax=Nannochloropsis gaditana TaxID=72520 RepID=W7TT68_9STRA|nr:hypothetical protein Naga_100573g1 [Nannochloropsis gaditana]
MVPRESTDSAPLRFAEAWFRMTNWEVTKRDAMVLEPTLRLDLSLRAIDGRIRSSSSRSRIKAKKYCK